MKKLIVAILAIAALLLAASYATMNLAVDNYNAHHIQLMQTLLPGSENYTLIPYDGEDANIKSIHKGENGYVIETVTDGYAGEITMRIGVNNDGFVTGLVIWEAHETPGLGNNALTDHVFLSQFLNKTGTFEVAVAGADAFSGATAVTETEGESIGVDAISGATVTSKAVVRCVNSAVAYVTGADAVSAATGWGG